MGLIQKYVLLFLVSIALLVVLEGVFRLGGIKARDSFFLPAGKGKLTANLKYFNVNNESRINNAQLELPKPEGRKRIFLLGASTIAGYHFNPHVHLGRWLELGLNDVSSQSNLEVINAGVGGADSSEVLRLFNEMLKYEPDLMIVLSDHNEFLEPNVRRFNLKRNHPSRARTLDYMRQSALLSWLSAEVRQRGMGVRMRAPFTEDRVVGTPFAGDEYANIIAAYRGNLASMAREATQRKIPLIIVKPVYDFSDWEPSGSFFSRSLAVEEQEIFLRQIESARQALDQGRFVDAEEALREVQAIDADVAELKWQWGRLFKAQGKWVEARKALKEAVALDAYPWRRLPEFHGVIDGVARETGVETLDAEEIFSRESNNGLIGENLIVDNCHPNLHGQFILSRALIKLIAERNMLSSSSNWDTHKMKTEEDYLGRLHISPDNLAWSYFRTAAYITNWSTIRYDGRNRLKRAIHYHELALEQKPGFPESLYAEAFLYRALGNEEEYSRLLRQASAVEPSIEKRMPQVSRQYAHYMKKPHAL